MAYDEATVMAGKDCRIFINQYDASGWTNSFGADESCQDLDASCFGASEQSKPGMVGLSINFAGLYPNAASINSLRDAVLAAGYSAGTRLETFKIIFLPGAITVGSQALHAMGSVRAGGVKSVGGDLSRMTMIVKPSGVYEINANVLHCGAETATGNGTTYDATAARVGAIGSTAHLSVYAWDSLTSLVVKVQDSANGTDWTDLITFTTATAVTSERKTTTAAVRRYRRAIWTIVGTGSCSFVLTFGEIAATA